MSFGIIGVGEVLWDLLPGGRQLGGAPANFAYHAAALGARARIISRVGRDENGRALLDRLAELGIITDSVEIDPVAPTGTVTVELARDGQPKFTIHENVAWDYLAGDEAARRAVANADAVCFGTLAQRHETSRRTIRSLVESAPPAALRILDVNLRQHFHSPDIIADSLALAHVLKVNETELPSLMSMLGMDSVGPDERAQLAALGQRFRLRLVAYTRGAHGSLLLAEGRWSEHPGRPTTVVDTVGAGDSFTAALTLGLLAGWPLDTIHDRATAVAAYVCSQPGGTPRLPDSILAPFRAIPSQSLTGPAPA